MATLGIACQVSTLKEVNTNSLIDEIMDRLREQSSAAGIIKSNLQAPCPICEENMKSETLDIPWSEKTLNNKLSEIIRFIIRNNSDIDDIYKIVETLGGTKLL